MKKAIWVVGSEEHEAKARRSEQYRIISMTHDIEFQRVDNHKFKRGQTTEITIVDEVS